MNIRHFDPAIAAAMHAELQRQESFIELIASENYASPNVLAAQGSCLTNKYADGYPGARTYSGCEYVDVVERIAKSRACTLFGAGYANVQPYSGSQANAAVYAALLEPNDLILGMAAEHGGHITHGAAVSFAGRYYRAVCYGTDSGTGEIDMDAVARIARQQRPKLIVAGYSAYSRSLDWQKFRDIADEVGAWLLVDMAHSAGLIAAGLIDNPLPFADVCTTTTHKTLRGPRGGMILARDDSLAEKLDAGVYPVTQGGPLMHVIAAKAIAFAEAAQPEFVTYQRTVLSNAQHLATTLAVAGFSIVTGGTDNHMLLIDLTPEQLAATTAVARLEAAHIAVSGWRLPGTQSTAPAAGLRLGTPAITTRGFAAAETEMLADLVTAVLRGGAASIASAHAQVAELCDAFPVYGAGAWPEYDLEPLSGEAD